MNEDYKTGWRDGLTDAKCSFPFFANAFLVDNEYNRGYKAGYRSMKNDKRTVF